MQSNRKFLVCKEFKLSAHKTGAPTPLNAELLVEAFTSEKTEADAGTDVDIYVFDTLQDASEFCITEGGAKPEYNPFSLFNVDYPIVEIEIDRLDTQPKLHKALKAHPGFKTLTNNHREVKTLTTDKTYQTAVKLSIEQKDIKAIHSAQGYKYALDYTKPKVEAANRTPDCRFM